MKRFIKIVICVLPFVLVLAIVLSLIPFIPAKNNDSEETNPQTQIQKFYGGQVVYASSLTGAEEVGRDQKGGAFYLGEYSKYTMTGGQINGRSKQYGGAFYVCKNAKLYINGGTIQDCRAIYGGAIYVEAGGECHISNATIKGCSAQYGAAIYVEEGGTLEIDDGSKILDNDNAVYLPPIEPDFELATELVGGIYDGISSTTRLNKVLFGSYPQTYVGNERNEKLENWYQNEYVVYKRIKPVKYYNLDLDSAVDNSYGEKLLSKQFPCFRGTDGNLYVRMTKTFPVTQKYHYKIGEQISSGVAWFKVEPISWYILNLDQWINRKEPLKLLSKSVIAANIQYFNLQDVQYYWPNYDADSSQFNQNDWYTSKIRFWLNMQFYKEAFSVNERMLLVQSMQKNTTTRNFNLSNDINGVGSQDYIYLPTYRDMVYDIFSGDGESPTGNAARLAPATDFSIANYCGIQDPILWSNDSLKSFYLCGGTAGYLLRSPGNSNQQICSVTSSGSVISSCLLGADGHGIRPIIQLKSYHYFGQQSK